MGLSFPLHRMNDRIVLYHCQVCYHVGDRSSLWLFPWEAGLGVGVRPGLGWVSRTWFLPQGGWRIRPRRPQVSLVPPSPHLRTPCPRCAHPHPARPGNWHELLPGDWGAEHRCGCFSPPTECFWTLLPSRRPQWNAMGETRQSRLEVWLRDRSYLRLPQTYCDFFTSSSTS